MDHMLDLHRTFLTRSILLAFLILTACAQADLTPTPFAESSLPAGAPTPVVVRILNLDLPLALSTTDTPAAPTSTLLPTLPPPTANPGASPSAAPSTSTIPACTNLAEFVKNLAIADNTAFKPGMLFAKIWQIKNAGTCTWTTDYKLVYASGESMGSPASTFMPHEVKPGETVDLRLSLVAPEIAKTYTGNWYLQDGSGATFGLGADGVQPLSVTIVVRPLPKPPI
jgi:hypothetical protein